MSSIVVSCGVLILAPGDELFACHATGTSRWDLPKGLSDPGETALQTAVRECWEETSLRLDPLALLDLGHFDYLPQKRLHLFALRVAAREAFDAGACRCHTNFVHAKSGREIPEVDGYAWKPLDRLPEWCGKNLSRVLGGLDRARLATLPALTRLDVRAAFEEPR